MQADCEGGLPSWTTPPPPPLTPLSLLDVLPQGRTAGRDQGMGVPAQLFVFLSTIRTLEVEHEQNMCEKYFLDYFFTLHLRVKSTEFPQKSALHIPRPANMFFFEDLFKCLRISLLAL